MFKTLSAALIAVSMLAAPVMAAGVAKTETTVIKTTTAPVVKPVASIDSKLRVKPAVRNANARMIRHHHRHIRHHHRFHKRMGALETNNIHSAAFKAQVTHVKRG